MGFAGIFEIMYHLHKAEMTVTELVDVYHFSFSDTQKECFDKLSKRFVHLLHNTGYF